MRDLLKAGSPQRLRVAAATAGWQRGETFPGPDGEALVSYVRSADGTRYLIEDPEHRPSPTAERLRALAVARFTNLCPACGVRGVTDEDGFAEAMREFESGRVQVVSAGTVAGGFALCSDVIVFALRHARTCPARPAMLAADAAAASN